ncbi:class I SAM-dependent methyltransferase [Lacinutrix undariae]
MNKDILNTKNQEFINLNKSSNPVDLLLKKHSNITVDIKELTTQIEAKKRCKSKLSTWYNTSEIYYPNRLNIEQTSSEITAEYKSNLVEGKSIIDLTGGFGVDCFYFSKQFKEVTHCEINESLSQIVSHNNKQFKIDNISTIHTDGISYLEENNTKYDWIYIDPSRRHDSKGKVFFLKDCLPNVPEYMDMLFTYSKNIMIKTSPLLDLSIGISELKHVKTIHVVSVNNEVKELLWILEDGFTAEVKIETANITKTDVQKFSFNMNAESDAYANYNTPQTFLYEPNVAILKSGAFKLLSEELNIDKLHPNSHLYTSDTLTDFPGRRFKIKNIIGFNKKEFKSLKINKANIACRNFPVSVSEVKKKLKINDGGDNYIFCTTDINEKKLLINCTKS